MVQATTLPKREHTRMPWRIHSIANDFRVEDVWALPTPGGPDDFDRLVELMTAFEPANASPVVGALFAIRWKLGRWLGLDRAGTGLGTRVASLRDRLPDDLRAGGVVETPDDSPFRPVYMTDREAALEIANETMHGVLHLGWVPDGNGGYRGQMAILVKPNGVVGRAYMAAIAPFRYSLVYPLMLRAIERHWQQLAKQVTVPQEVRELSTLDRVDYADAFVVDAGAHPDWTAVRWARAMLEEAPTAMRTRLLAGWTALGLKSADDAHESVLGWDVRWSSADAVLLGRDSRIGMPGELLFALRPEGLLFATFGHHRTPVTRAVWAATERTHVRIVLELLDRVAAADVTESAGAG